MGRTTGPSWSTGWRGWAWAALATAGYVLVAAWAHQFAVTADRDLTIWYPGPGILLGLFVECRRWRFVAALALGELISSVVVFAVDDVFDPAQLVLNAVAIAAAYGAGGLVLLRLRRVDGPPSRLPDLLALVAGGVGVGALGAAVLGTAMQRWVGLATDSSFLTGVRLWWVSDSIGVLALAPAVMLLAPRPGARLRHHAVDLISVLAGIAVVAGPSLVLWMGGDRPFRFVYLVFLPVVVVAIRHGTPGAVLAVAVTHVGMTMEVDRLGGGTVGRDDLQLLLLVASVAGLVIGLLVSEQRAGARRMAELGEIIEATSDLVATVGSDGSFRYLNGAGRELLGLQAGRSVDGLPASVFFGDELAHASAAAVAPAVAGSPNDASPREPARESPRESPRESKVQRADGEMIPVSFVLVPHLAADGANVVSAVVRDISTQRRVEDELARRALHDDHTGLANRALFFAEVRRACARAERSPGWLGVLHIDIDRFKVVNDTLGHDAGDAVIRELAGRLRVAVGEADLLARLGGDEFCVLLEDLPDPDRAIELGAQLIGLLGEQIVVDGTPVSLSASIGVAIAELIGNDPSALLRRADLAMHRAKRSGGGNVVRFDPQSTEPGDARRELAADLAAGIRAGTWSLVYQPIVETRSRRIVGAEALFRWEHPEFGPLPTSEVVAIAEETGLIVPLGLDILRRACADAAAWPEANGGLRVSVNLSAVQLRDAALVEHVGEVLDASGLDPRRLVLEVTETALVADLPTAAASLRELRRRGVAVALDDFGTGYSSLASLRELPIDQIKLDRAFVTGLGGAVADEILVAAVLTMARGLGLTVVAEGVEERRQLERLTAYGCDRVQGYLLKRPMPADDWSDLLAASEPGFVLAE